MKSQGSKSTTDPGSATADIRPLRMSIRSKMIALSTLLLVGAISAFGAINARQARRNIANYTENLRRTISEGLRQAGRAQLTLLAASARITLLQNDYGSLKDIVRDVQQQDARITKVAIFSPDRKLIADMGEGLAKDVLSEVLGVAKGLTTKNEILVGQQKSILFAVPVSYRDRLLGTALIAYSLRELELQLAEAEEQKQRTAAANLRNIVIVGLLAGLLGTLLTVLQGMRISRPIRALANQANHIAAGDFSARVDIKGHDEIGQLGDAFNHMSAQIVSLLESAQEKAAIQREFELANSIQSALVPDMSAVELCGMEISGFFQPASECGGDWWSYYRIVGDKALLIIGDVTGHGVAAAMITAVVKGAADTLISVSHAKFSLAQLLEQLNAVVYEAGARQFFMTSFVALYDPATGTLSYANAGHTMPYRYIAESKKVTSLAARGTWLGYSASQSYTIEQTQLEKDDLIVLYTDGIVELENADGREFGERRFRRLLAKSSGLPLAELQQHIVDDVYSFADGEPQQDDITLVLAKVLSSPQA